MTQENEIPCTNEIRNYLYCSLCEKERPSDISAESWQRISVGATPIGLQIWCYRHMANIVHIDFEGRTMRACTEIESLVN